MKYESSITYHSKAMANVKVFVDKRTDRPKTTCTYMPRVRIHQPFSRTFFVFVSKICKFECNTTSDWLNRTV